MDKEKISAFLENLIDLLTFRRVALLTLLFAISIGMLSIFENRAALFATVYTSSAPAVQVKWDLSNESKNQLIGVLGVQHVGAVIVSDVNLKKNHRVIKFHTAKDPIMAEEMRKVVVKLLPQSLFDFDEKNTTQMLSMLNNEFTCAQTRDTILIRFFQQFADQLPVVCRMAVPPFFGEFAGMISIFVSRPLKPEEFDSLKIVMNRVAIEIYLRDIAKKAQP